MANPFDTVPVNALQAMLMGREGRNDAFQARMQPLQMQEQEGKIRARDALSAMLQGGGAPDYDRMAIGMLAAGDPAGAGVLANLTNQKSQRALQERSVALQEEAAREKPQYQVVTEEDASGNKRPRIVKLEPLGRGASYVDPAGTPTAAGAPTNPYSTGGKVNEAQSKDQLYANRMFGAERVLRDTEEEGTDFFQRGLSKLPGVGNMLISQKMQSLEQAKRDFVNAVLRRESGAAISSGEFDNAEKQYFPQPGDTKDTIAQKRRNRAEAIKGVAGGGGPSYRPPATFDEAGDLIPNISSAGGPPPMGAPTASPAAMRQAGALAPIPGAPQAPTAGAPGGTDIRAQAEDAIRRGANPKAVAKRLLDNNIDPSEIGLTWP